MKYPRRLVLTVLAVLMVPGLAAAQRLFTGQTAGGAFYQIAAPVEWQPGDSLVIWNHGFDLNPPGPEPDLGPLAALQLGEGYAVAASSYSLNGWALFQTLTDLRQLYQAFVDELGTPGEVIVYGASLGGIVTAQALEGGGLGNVVGAMPICGALGGSRIWNGALDLRLLYDHVCGDVPGAAIPGGAQGLPFPPDPAFDATALGLAVNACTGVVLPPAARSAEQQARLDELLALTALPENFLLVDMGFATFAMADLNYDPRKLAGGQALGNADVDYGDAAVNAGIERVAADPAVLDRFLDFFTPAGRVGDVKIVSIHTDKDGLVLLENESEYAAVVPRRQFTLGVVVEDVPSHCGFTEGEIVAAWESLRGWVAGLPQPDAQALQDACEGLVAGGLVAGPCRIDPGFAVADLNDRVRPRAACAETATSTCLNEGRFQVEVAWEDFDGNAGPGIVTPLRTDDTGSFYFFGPQNVELMVKALDGRQNNGNFWIFYGSLTNVAFELTVTDSETGLTKTYENGSGEFASAGDTAAF
jgi:pimeloyl-ACP methyl ester carboxylesterase